MTGTAPVAITPRNSMPGKKTELSRCATKLARRFSPFSTSNVRCELLFAVVRLHDGHARDRLGDVRRDGRDPDSARR